MGGTVSSSVVSGGCVSDGCVGIVSGGVVGVGFVSSIGSVGVVGVSVACWGALVSSVLFSDGSGTVGVDGAGSDVADPDAALSRDSVGSVWKTDLQRSHPNGDQGHSQYFYPSLG